MWMRYSIDVLFLDKKDRIIKTIESLPPFRFSTIVRSSAAVLEIASGSIKRLGIEIDDILILR